VITYSKIIPECFDSGVSLEVSRDGSMRVRLIVYRGDKEVSRVYVTLKDLSAATSSLVHINYSEGVIQ
jgi:hypothetical protein